MSAWTHGLHFEYKRKLALLAGLYYTRDELAQSLGVDGAVITTFCHNHGVRTPHKKRDRGEEAFTDLNILIGRILQAPRMAPKWFEMLFEPAKKLLVDAENPPLSLSQRRKCSLGAAGGGLGGAFPEPTDDLPRDVLEALAAQYK